MSNNKDSVRLGLIQALQAIDSQIARAMQRTPSQREVHGAQKWQPYSDRIERIAAQLLDALNDGEIGMDSLLVISQALVKALSISIDDLGRDGLGEVRSDYCALSMQSIGKDAERAQDLLRGRTDLV